MRKVFIFVSVVCSFCLSAFAQEEVNKVTIDDCEERLIWLYWSQDYKTLTEQTTLLISLDKTYAGRNYFRLGIAHLHLGEKEKSLEAFKKGAFEDSYFPYNFAGLALLEKEGSKKILLYRKALLLSDKYNLNHYSDKRPENFGLSTLLPKSNAWINHNIGVTYLQEKKYDSAQYYFKKASNERPEDAEHLIALAVTNYYLNNKAIDKSMKSLKQASKLPNIDYRVATLKAYLEYTDNNIERSTKYLERVKSTEYGNSIVQLLKLVLSETQISKEEFEASLFLILNKDENVQGLKNSIEKSTSENYVSIILETIQKDLFTLSPYYNPQIYPAGGYSSITFDGKKNIKERMFIQE